MLNSHDVVSYYDMTVLMKQEMLQRRTNCAYSSEFNCNLNKRPRGHIAHLSNIGKYFAYEHMQHYFSLLPLDHLARKFELFFGSVGF
jgi:hypothetical protein